jgi:hypothetical protein
MASHIPLLPALKNASRLRYPLIQRDIRQVEVLARAWHLYYWLLYGVICGRGGEK